MFSSLLTVQPEDGHWGSLVTGEDNSTSEWTGMVRQLMDGKADICGASLTISKARSEVIDFSLGVIEEITSIIYPNPAKSRNGRPTQINLMVFLTVFSKAAWLAILLLAVVVALSQASLRVCQSSLEVTMRLIVRNIASGLYNFFLFLIERNEDARDVSRGMSARIFFLTVSAASFVLLTYYEGDLTASMTVGMPAPSLASFDDVLQAGYNLHAPPGTFQYDLVAKSKPGSSLNKLFKTRFESIGWDYFMASQRENPTKTVYYGPQFRPEIMKLNEFLHLKNFREATTSQLAFAFQKDSELRDLFNYHLIKITQSGMLKQQMSKWLTDSRPQDNTERIFQDDPLSLGYENLLFPMTIMMLGMAGATLIFILEQTCRDKRPSLKL